MTYFLGQTSCFQEVKLEFTIVQFTSITYKFQTGFRDIRLAAVKISFIHASWTNVL